jgi:hypothetical protein
MPAFLQPLAQWVRVIGAVSDHPFRLLPRPAFSPGDADLCERGFRKRSFTRKGTFQPNSPVEDPGRRPVPSTSFPCRAWFYHRSAPFFAGAKLPSRKLSSHFSRPSRPGRPATLARNRARRPPLPTASDDASKWPWTGIYLAETATLLLFAAPRESPPDAPGLRPRTAAIILQPLRLWQQRFDSLPLRIGQQNESLLAHF